MGLSAPAMSLPKPNASFKIPSIHDDIELDCRIYYPRRTERNSRTFGRSFAIVAHPYAPLGGCSDDPVVALVGSVLLLHGLVLATFNFRYSFGMPMLPCPNVDGLQRSVWVSRADVLVGKA